MAGGSFAPRKGSVTPPEPNDLRVVNAIPAHIWRAAPDGAVQFVNQQWMDYTGLSQATQLPIIVFSAEGRLLHANRFSLTYGGLSLEDFQRDGWRERVYHPDDFEGFADARREGLARSAPFESEVRIRRAADGTHRWSSSPARFTSVQRARPVRLWP
jgi:PAS domain-containing protein